MCALFFLGDFMEKYMKEAIKEAKKSLKKDDVPIGAIIVKENKIIARAHNLKENKNNAIYHAEILAINKACKKLNRWRLNDCTLYVTMEPCLMCTGAIIQSRIKKVYYSIKNDDFGALDKLHEKYKIETNSGLCADESLTMLKTFFDEKRKK